MSLYVFVCSSLAILKCLSQLSPRVDWHKLTYLVLTCRKTSIKHFIMVAMTFNVVCMWYRCDFSRVFPLILFIAVVLGYLCYNSVHNVLPFHFTFYCGCDNFDEFNDFVFNTAVYSVDFLYDLGIPLLVKSIVFRFCLLHVICSYTYCNILCWQSNAISLRHFVMVVNL